MKPLKEILQNGTIPMLRARRRQLTAFRDICSKDGYREIERLDAESDIMDLNDKIKDLERL